MNMKYKPPEFNATAFSCPHCNAYAKQSWSNLFRLGGKPVLGTKVSDCEHCNDYIIWLSGTMIFPDALTSPPPNPDLDEDIQNDYREAQSIVHKSPRGATALLRLCIQKLCTQLGEEGKIINNDIKSLVEKGLPTEIQQALDFVRVVGNNAVHPGTIDLTKKDNEEIAVKLFELVNFIADLMITQPQKRKQLYETVIPEEERKRIKERDG